MYYKHNIRKNEENNLQQVFQMYTSMIRDVASEVSSSLCCLKRRSQQSYKYFILKLLTDDPGYGSSSDTHLPGMFKGLHSNPWKSNQTKILSHYKLKPDLCSWRQKKQCLHSVPYYNTHICIIWIHMHIHNCK